MSLAQMKEILTPQQQECAELIAMNELEYGVGGKRKTLEEIGEIVGVSRQSIHKWKQIPAFLEYMSHVSSQHMAATRPMVYSQLLTAIRGGNNGIPSIKAIELYLKLSGDLVERREVTHVEDYRTPMSREQIAAELEEITRRLH
ncbi:hypothetical protein MHZ92_19920 [Sporosarcina sp. ACRSL]|uniref:phBC6A51 family helix-turn-helix protein n=1 Tax=Sporosarcina sp. ACRSL TaxID=2918215 RepID=UPI001EF5C414|nr:phBC6A51 family helix-turn-helix protein [Sporosarcina sp. ACRSL]MCG7346376.1 hypothetical protein [Sporosarcina sp. ACRSL]